MVWYRVKSTHDQWGPRDRGKVFQAEGTIRNLMLVKAGYLEEVPELSPELKPTPRVLTEPPVGSTVARARRRRGVQAEAGSDEGEDVREEPGDSARSEDGSAGGDGGQADSSDPSA